MPHDEDDQIPDPNDFMFIGDDYNPQIFMKMVMASNRALVAVEATVGELAKVSVKTELAIEKMANSIADFTLAQNGTKKDIEAINQRIEDRKEEDRKHTILIEKLFERTDKFDNELHQSCDLYNKRNTDYTDKEIGKVLKYLGIGSIVAVALLGVMYNDIKDNILRNDNHTHDSEIHIKKKGK